MFSDGSKLVPPTVLFLSLPYNLSALFKAEFPLHMYWHFLPEVMSVTKLTDLPSFA